MTPHPPSFTRNNLDTMKQSFPESKSHLKTQNCLHCVLVSVSICHIDICWQDKLRATSTTCWPSSESGGGGGGWVEGEGQIRFPRRHGKVEGRSGSAAHTHTHTHRKQGGVVRIPRISLVGARRARRTVTCDASARLPAGGGSTRPPLPLKTAAKHSLSAGLSPHHCLYSTHSLAHSLAHVTSHWEH